MKGAPQVTQRLSHVSLFTGAGGLDLGLEKAGFETLIQVEKDTAAQLTLARNRHRSFPHSTGPVVEDITHFGFEDFLIRTGLDRGELTLLSGGPPCQSFSTAGHRQSIVDPRGSLFGKFLYLVGEMQPRFFLLENVRGLLSAALRHRPLAERGDDHRPLEHDEELGSLLEREVLPYIREELKYDVVVGLVDAADYGAPQHRQRVVFIGAPKGTSDISSKPISELMPPTHSTSVSGGLKRHRTLGDAIKRLRHDPGPGMTYSPARASVFAKVPPGKNWRFFRDNPEVADLESVMGGAYHSTGGRVGFWRRLSWEKPSPTLPTSPVQKATGLCHPDEVRPLSVKEYARIQGFPSNYVFEGSVAAQYRQIGNAVPVQLAQAAGEALARLARDTALPVHPSGPDRQLSLERPASSSRVAVL